MIERLVDELARQDPAEIRGFADRLAEALYAIDTRAHMQVAQPAVNEVDGAPPGAPLSDDVFLYARCAVVAHGQAAYEDFRYRHELAEAAVAGAEWGEFLLSAASDAWERATGTEWEHVAAVSYETGSNAAGWTS